MFINLLAALLMYSATPVASEDGSLHYLIAGDYQDLAYGKDNIYTASGFGLSALNFDLTSLQHVQSVNYSQKLALSGKRIWLGDGDKITLFRISSDGPEEVSSYKVPGLITALFATKQYLVAGTDSGKIILFGNSDVFESLAVFETEGEPKDFANYGDFLYVACGKEGVEIIEIGKNPEKRGRLGEFSVNAVAVANDQLFAASPQSQIICYSLENPSVPEKKKEFSTGSPAISMEAFDKHLYTAHGHSGYSIFTLKGQEIEGSEKVEQGFVTDVLPTDKGVYLALRDYGVLRLTGKKPKSLMITQRFTKTAPAIHISQGGAFWGIAQGRAGVKILRLTGDTAVSGYAEPLPVDARGSAISGSYLYVADAARGLSIFSLKDLPAEREFDLSQPGEPMRVVTSEDLIYLAAGPRGIRISWICPCGPLKQKAAFEDDIFAQDVAVKDSLIFAADPKTGIRILHLWDSTKKYTVLSPITTYEGAISPQAILRDEDILWVADSVGALIALDISDPGSPEQTSFTLLGVRPYGLALNEDDLYLACGERGVLTVDVSNPEAPVKGSFHETPGRALAVVLSSEYLGVADYTSVMLIPRNILK